MKLNSRKSLSIGQSRKSFLKLSSKKSLLEILNQEEPNVENNNGMYLFFCNNTPYIFNK